jgi:hypothetical protein
MSRLDLRTLKVSWPIQGLLVITLGLIVFTYFRSEKNEPPPPEPAAKASANGPGATVAANQSSPASASQAGASETVAANQPPPVDIFPSQSWLPPPPPPPPAPPPESIKPPPMPFTVRSLWLDEHGVFYILLAGAGREFPVCGNCHKQGFLRKGDVILNAYKIEDINRKEVRFMYLPLKNRQTLPLGELK